MILRTDAVIVVDTFAVAALLSLLLLLLFVFSTPIILTTLVYSIEDPVVAFGGDVWLVVDAVPILHLFG